VGSPQGGLKFTRATQVDDRSSGAESGLGGPDPGLAPSWFSAPFRLLFVGEARVEKDAAAERTGAPERQNWRGECSKPPRSGGSPSGRCPRRLDGEAWICYYSRRRCGASHAAAPHAVIGRFPRGRSSREGGTPDFDATKKGTQDTDTLISARPLPAPLLRLKSTLESFQQRPIQPVPSAGGCTSARSVERFPCRVGSTIAGRPGRDMRRPRRRGGPETGGVRPPGIGTAAQTSQK
jgi:hypothetical protein